jgi:hypothetical protein
MYRGIGLVGAGVCAAVAVDFLRRRRWLREIGVASSMPNQQCHREMRRHR